MAEPPPPLSIVLPTIDGWPQVAGPVRSVESTASRAGGEVIVVDGSGLPAPTDLGPTTRWLSHPGESVYQLRLRGYQAARGDVVAATEDHCVSAPDWAERILQAHAEWPDAAVVVGAVENATAEHPLDRASYFVNAVSLGPPVPRGPVRGHVTHINVSYKRDALASIDDRGGLGIADFLHGHDLQRRGAKVYRDGRIRVAHRQSLGFRGTTAVHFHAGRTIAAFRRQRMDLRGWVRAIGTPAAALLRFGRIVAIGLGKPNRRRFVTSLPGVLWLVGVQATGQIAGYVTGPGDSPYKVD